MKIPVLLSFVLFPLVEGARGSLYFPDLLIHHNHHTSIIRIDGEDGMGDIFFVEECKKTLHFPSELDHIIDNNHRSIVCMRDDRKKEIESEALVSVDKYEIIGLR